MLSASKYRAFCQVMFLLLLAYKVETKETLNGNGTFYINAIIPMFGENYTINYETGIMALEGLKFAIDMFNTVLNKPLHGYQFKLHKIHVPDPFNKKKMYDMLLFLLHSYIPDSPVSFVIGPRYTGETVIAENIIGFDMVDIPVYSYGASSSSLDELSKNCENNLKSSVPSDTFRFQVLIDLFIKFKWNYAATIASAGYDGSMDATVFRDKIEPLGVCISEQIQISNNPDINDIEASLKRLDQSIKAQFPLKAVILFTKDEDSRKVLIALRNLKLEHRFLLVFAYGSANFYEVYHGYEEVVLGSLTIDYGIFSLLSFKERYLNLNPSNTDSLYFHLFWEDLFQCELSTSDKLQGVTAPMRKKYAHTCTGNEKMSENKGYYPYSLAGRLFDAFENIVVTAFYHIVNVCRKCTVSTEGKPCYYPNAKICPFNPDATIDGSYRRSTRSLMCPHTYNNRFNGYAVYKEGKKTLRDLKYDIWSFMPVNGTFQNVKVGKWVLKFREDMQDEALLPEEALEFGSRNLSIYKQIYWKNHTGFDPPQAICSAFCKPGFIREYLRIGMTKSCCWNCLPCSKRHIIIDNKCKACKFGESANLTSNQCYPLPEHFLELSIYSDPLVITLAILAVIGIVFVVFVVIVYVRFNRNHIIRSSGRDLSYSILVGLFLLFACPFLFLTQPSEAVCAFRDILPNLSFLLCYAALCLKVSRIYRIFVSAQTRVSRPIFITPSSQIIMLGGISLVQFLISGMWFISSAPGTEKLLSENELFITHHCKDMRNFGKFFVNMAPSIIFMLSCTVLAFKTRNFPKNYNEAKYIANTLFVTLICWGSFLTMSCFPRSSDTFFSEYSMSILCIVIAYVTLFGLFSHKLVLLFQRKPLEDHHDSLKSRARSLSSSQHKECNMNGSDELAF